MNSIRGSDIARLVLGYLQSEQLDQIAFDFCKTSPYLREEYKHLKRGLKIIDWNNKRSLIDIIRQFIEIEGIVNEFFEKELNRHEVLPDDLARVRSLKDMVQYLCRTFQTSTNQPSQSQAENNVPSRKRGNAEMQTDSDSDSTGSSCVSTHTTSVQDLPGTRNCPAKRPKMSFDGLIIGRKNDLCLENVQAKDRVTPFKTNPQDPTSSKYLPASASKAIGLLTESMMSSNFPKMLAENINNEFDHNISVHQLPEKMPQLVRNLEFSLNFEDLVGDICQDQIGLSLNSSSSVSGMPSGPEDDTIELATNRQLDTPIPTESSGMPRYSLRSQRKSTASSNTPTELNRIPSNKDAKGKAQITHEIILKPLPLQTQRDEPILIDSDSEGAVTTTSQIQQPTSGQVYFFLNSDPNPYYIFPAIAGQNNLADTYTIQPSTSTIPIKMAHTVNQTDQYSQFFTAPSDQKKIDVLIDPNAMQSNQIAVLTLPNQDNRNRLIEMNPSDIDNEGQIKSEVSNNPAQKQEEITSNEQTNSISNTLIQFQHTTSDQKVVTPEKMIKTSIPCSSKSLSEPRNKNPVCRVLDLDNTPKKFIPQLSGITELVNLSSKFSSNTPQNRSIISSTPRSAPPKINSVMRSERVPGQKIVESTSTDAFNPIDENTAISAGSDTPRVRKTDRNSCKRTISTHKEINAEENQKRLKRVAKTKKKICQEDGDSNEAKSSVNTEEVPPTKEDALAEWERVRLARLNPEQFEKNLREQNSKNQETKLPAGRKKNSRRTKKKPAPKTKQILKKSLNESNKSVDMSINSSIDESMLNSTETNLEAQLLEANLKSAKKVTPIKQINAPKSAKKKTHKVQIKLMPSPKNKLKRQKNAKKEPSTLISYPANEKEEKLEGNLTEKPIESESQTVIESETKLAMLTTENTNDDLEVAQNLITMQEVILEQARKHTMNPEIQIDSVSMSEKVEEVPPIKETDEPMKLDGKNVEVLKNSNPSNLNISELLETPYKQDNSWTIPKTPCPNALPPNLQTPMPYPSEPMMTYSMLKNSLFTTPLIAITPGASYNPSMDTISPRSDQEIVYGAANRPTDYSSSSSYYKPDESDGMDKQIQATIHKNNSCYSADEMDESSKLDDTTQNTLNDSSSSSSSSSDSSDSDSDSDSSSSSDSDVSRVSNKSTEEVVQPNEAEKAINSEEIVDEDSKLQMIKSHLIDTQQVNIMQNILLAVPEAPPLNEGAKHQALLDEKRRRMQESLRNAEMQNYDKIKPKQTKKFRPLNEIKRDRLRAPLPVPSPSKRKSSQPKKIVSLESSQKVYSHVVNVMANQSEQMHRVEIKTQSVTTERLITEAAGDNAIVDASDVSTTQKTQVSSAVEEESVEAIERHINKSRESVEDALKEEKVNKVSTKSKTQAEKLVETLSEKQKKFDANRPKMKTEVIAALPMVRTTRSRAKNQMLIRPAQNIIANPPASVSNNSKPTIDPKIPRRSKEKSIEKIGPVSVKKGKINPHKKEATKTVAKESEQNKAQPIKATSSNSNKPSESLITPAKVMKRQMVDIFGDTTDIDTPIKSAPNSGSCIEPKPIDVEEKKESPSEAIEISVERSGNKFEADSSNVGDEASSDSDGDEDDYEMIFSIDESDKKRFINLQESSPVKSRGECNVVCIGTKTVYLEENVKITLAPSDEMELYGQNSMEMCKERQRSRRESKNTKKESNEPSSSSDDAYGKPLHTSTPSPTKTITPKFNIKHKSSESVSPKSAKKQGEAKGESHFESIQIDDVLNKLHA